MKVKTKVKAGVFGKRTSVRDAHDRYANLETN